MEKHICLSPRSFILLHPQVPGQGTAKKTSAQTVRQAQQQQEKGVEEVALSAGIAGGGRAERNLQMSCRKGRGSTQATARSTRSLKMLLRAAEPGRGRGEWGQMVRW